MSAAISMSFGQRVLQVSQEAQTQMVALLKTSSFSPSWIILINRFG
jgi:hypothetical protein